MSEDNPVADPGHELISSRRVEGTPVFGADGEKLGTIHSVMIHKLSGQVAYALLSFGGFLHVGERVHPVPWGLLTYDPARGGYAVNLTRETLDKAPTLALDAADRPSDRAFDEQLYGYYSVPGFWGAGGAWPGLP